MRGEQSREGDETSNNEQQRATTSTPQNAVEAWEGRMEERSRTTEQVPRVVATTREVERRRGKMAGAEILDQEGENAGVGATYIAFLSGSTLTFSLRLLM